MPAPIQIHAIRVRTSFAHLDTTWRAGRAQGALLPSSVRRQGDADTPDPRLVRILVRWLALGALAMLLFPAARGDSALIGWWPLWLVGAPLSSLLLLFRHRLAAAWSRILVPGPRRRRRRGRGQARRMAASGFARRARLRAA